MISIACQLGVNGPEDGVIVEVIVRKIKTPAITVAFTSSKPSSVIAIHTNFDSMSSNIFKKLVTSAFFHAVIDDAIRFVSERSKGDANIEIGEEERAKQSGALIF